MALYQMKSLGREIVHPLVRPLFSVHPNTITWVSLLFAVAAALCLYSADLGWVLLLTPVFITLRMMCNLLDGMVAIERAMTSPQGEALQDTVDRLADSCMVLGAAFSPIGDLRLGIVAITLMLISSYVGIQKKAVGGSREYGGILGKGDRFLLFSIASVGRYFWQGRAGGLNAFDILFVLMIIGGSVTIIQRGTSIREMKQ